MSRMNLTDLLPDEIYTNQSGEIAQLKEMDGNGNVFVKILKEIDGKYEREETGNTRNMVKFHTSMFLTFWIRMKTETTKQ